MFLFPNAAVLRSADNRRLLAYLLSSVPDLTEEFHKVIKEKGIAEACSSNNSTRLFHYGEIYLKAWTMARDDTSEEENEDSDEEAKAADKTKATRSSIERICLQNLLHLCIHAACPDMFKASRRLLS